MACGGSPACLICLTEPGTPREVCGHTYCSECWEEYLLGRIRERRAVSISCPAAATIGCTEPIVTAVEVKTALGPDSFSRYLECVSIERTNQDPCTRWCPSPGCSTVCQPWVWDPPPLPPRIAVATTAVLAVAGAACAVAGSVFLDFSASLAALTTITGIIGGVTVGLQQVYRNRKGPWRRSICSQCGASACYDCRSAWHPGRSCDEVAADMVSNWCLNEVDGGQCPNCGIFIERVQGCNHMTCLCTHEYCWLCNEQWRSCNCPLSGGQPNRTSSIRIRSSQREFVDQAVTFHMLGVAFYLIWFWQSSLSKVLERVPQDDSVEAAFRFTNHLNFVSHISKWKCLMTTIEGVLGALSLWHTGCNANVFVLGFRPGPQVIALVLLLAAPHIVVPTGHILADALAWCLAFPVQLLGCVQWLWPLRMAIACLAAMLVLLVPATCTAWVEGQIMMDLANMSGINGWSEFFKLGCNLKQFMADTRILAHLMIVVPEFLHNSNSLWATIDAAFGSGGVWHLSIINPLAWLRGTQVNFLFLCAVLALLLLDELSEMPVKQITEIPSFLHTSILRHGLAAVRMCFHAVVFSLVLVLEFRLLFGRFLDWVLYHVVASHAMVFCLVTAVTLRRAVLNTLQLWRLGDVTPPHCDVFGSDRCPTLFQCHADFEMRSVMVICILVGLILQEIAWHFGISISSNTTTLHRAILLAALPSIALLLAGKWFHFDSYECPETVLAERAEAVTASFEDEFPIEVEMQFEPLFALMRRRVWDLQPPPIQFVRERPSQVICSIWQPNLRSWFGHLGWLGGGTTSRALQQELSERRRERQRQFRASNLKQARRFRAQMLNQTRNGHRPANQRNLS